MCDYEPGELIWKTCSCMGMSPGGNEPYGCGVRLEGDGKTIEGYLWYLAHENHFVISQCDFVFCRDTQVDFPVNARYISLRLDYARHLSPGKMLAFMEEKGGSANTLMKRGARVAYTEIMYLPSFYKKHLETCFASVHISPVEILKNTGREHNWPSEMVGVLTDILQSRLTGMAAELYFVAKAYELMAELITMANSRLPKKTSDYDHILRVLQYIDQNYAENIKQSDLVSLSSMSATKLKNLFRHFTGRTVTDYIMGKKVDRASQLLAVSDMSIEQIAKSLGFDTPTGFTTSFKKRIGIPPSEYRKCIVFNCLRNPSQIENLSFGDIPE